MIQLETYKNKSYYVGFRLSGHARLIDDSDGNAKVCASVSFLSQTCVNFIEDVLKVKNEFYFDKDGGFADFSIKDIESQNKEDVEKASLLIESMEYGIINLSNIYPEYIETTSREVKI